MIYNLFLWLAGRTGYRAKNAGASLVNRMLSLKLPVFGIRAEGCDLLFDSLSISRKRVLKALAGQSIEYKGYGLPALLRRYRKRWGLQLGALCFALILWLSTRFVWQINVIGNESLDDQTIISDLDSLGFRVGSYIPDINVRLLCNEYLLRYDKVAWMSINIVGNCADIRIKESKDPDGTKSAGDSAAGNSPGDIIAALDGYIERIEVRNGQVMIGTGHTVRRGEVIVSGAVEMATGYKGLVRADADIYARTVRNYRIEIPRSTSTLSAETIDAKDRSLIFFSNRLPLFSVGDGYEDCESFCDTRYLTLPGGISLPFGIATTYYRRISEIPETIDNDTAKSRALLELSKTLSRELGQAEIIYVGKNYVETDETLILEASVCSVENIARYRSLVTP